MPQILDSVILGEIFSRILASEVEDQSQFPPLSVDYQYTFGRLTRFLLYVKNLTGFPPSRKSE